MRRHTRVGRPAGRGEEPGEGGGGGGSKVLGGGRGVNIHAHVNVDLFRPEVTPCS